MSMLHQCLLLAEVSQELGVPDAQLFSCVDRCDHLGVPARIYDRILASDKELLYLPLLRKLSTFCSFSIQILLICKPFCDLKEITMNASLSGMTKQNVMTVGEITYLGFFVMFVSHYSMVSPLMTT